MRPAGQVHEAASFEAGVHCALSYYFVVPVSVCVCVRTIIPFAYAVLASVPQLSGRLPRPPSALFSFFAGRFGQLRVAFAKFSGRVCSVNSLFAFFGIGFLAVFASSHLLLRLLLPPFSNWVHFALQIP